MSPFDPIIDASFRQYADLQLRRNTLLTEGKEQSPVFDRTEDQMTELWEKLDDTQRQSVNGMGSDLNWLRRKGQLAPKSRKAEEITPAEQQELLAARQSNEWHGFLHYLRVCSPTIPAANLAFLRGQAYAAIDLPSYSYSFYELATELEPANASIGLNVMLAMIRLDYARALTRAERVLASSVRLPPAVAALSTDMLLRRDKAEGRTIDKARYGGILEEAIKRLKLEPLPEAGQALIYQLAAFGFEAIDEQSTALKCCEAGLSLSPGNEILLIGKGLLLYGNGNRTDEAVAAFRRVVSNEGTPFLAPYFYLAHYFLLQKNYDDFVKMAKLAWERAKTDPIRATLLEWQAIFLSESGYPPEVVRPCFEKALSLDPANEGIRRNLEAFAEPLSANQERKWDIEAAETLRDEIAPNMIDLGLLAVA